MSDNLINIKDSLQISIEYDDNDKSLVVLYLKGFLDTYNSPDFHREINNIIEKGYKNVIFECSELNYISSVGIGIFTTLLKQLRQLNGDLVLVGLQAKVLDIFLLLGFSKFFHIEKTIEDSKQKMQNMTFSDLQFGLSHFPTIVKCPHCKKNLRALKAGRFRCSQCKKILSIDENVHVSFS